VSNGPGCGAHLVDQVLTTASQTEPPAAVLWPLVARLLQILEPLVEARQSRRRAVLQTFRESVRLDRQILDGVARNLRECKRQFRSQGAVCGQLQVLTHHGLEVHSDRRERERVGVWLSGEERDHSRAFLCGGEIACMSARADGWRRGESQESWLTEREQASDWGQAPASLASCTS
jgi:hypothetical protein